MANDFTSRIRHAWNVFRAKNEDTNIQDSPYTYTNLGMISTVSPTRPLITRGNERSIITSAFNRIAIDVAGFDIQHIKTDQNGRYLETIDDSLNQCLTIEANKDQTGRAFIQDIVMSMFDEGAIAVVPVDTTISPTISGSFEIHSMRVGKIVEWFPNHIRVELYNDKTGMKERVTLPKYITAIIENPLYAIVNEPNSTFKRLIRKLNMLDSADEVASSGKLVPIATTLSPITVSLIQK